MPRIKQSLVSVGFVASSHRGFNTQYLVAANSGEWYWIYIDAVLDIVYRKRSADGSAWSDETVIFTGSCSQVAVWYDRWSDISAGLIHVAYTDTGNDDTLYRTIDTENSDALSTETTIFAGASTAGSGALSIARARGGNVYCRTVIDAGAEGGFFRLPNANVPNGAWDAARTVNEALAIDDQAILLPGWAADNQDMMLIFWDASADEISRQLYDDSANSWGETSIAASFVYLPVSNYQPNMAACVDISNSQNLLIAWSGADTANADLQCWTVTESAITAKTDVVTNGTDDQALCAIGIDTATNYWYAWYGGKSDGSETWGTDINVYMKVSQDGGSTWGAETLVTPDKHTQNISSLCCVPRFSTQWGVIMREGGFVSTAAGKSSVLWPQVDARAQLMLGV